MNTQKKLKKTVTGTLTKRETEILQLVVKKEYNNKQLAKELKISVRTVETHMKHIYRKTSSHNKVGLVKYAYKEH